MAQHRVEDKVRWGKGIRQSDRIGLQFGAQLEYGSANETIRFGTGKVAPFVQCRRVGIKRPKTVEKGKTLQYSRNGCRQIRRQLFGEELLVTQENVVLNVGKGEGTTEVDLDEERNNR